MKCRACHYRLWTFLLLVVWFVVVRFVCVFCLEGFFVVVAFVAWCVVWLFVHFYYVFVIAMYAFCCCFYCVRCPCEYSVVSCL